MLDVDIGMERMYVPRRKMSQLLGFEVEEVENGAVDVFQVIAKHLTRVGCSLLEVTGEVQLRARDVRSAVDCFSLLPLSPNSYGRFKQLLVFSDLTKRQPSSSAKTTSLACPSLRPSRQKSVTIEAFVFDENAQVAVLREKRWCAIQGSNL